MRVDSLLIHDIVQPSDGPATPPLVRSSAFRYKSATDLAAVFDHQQPGYIYSRLGNPTLAVLEQRVAALERGVGAVAFASGMAAISALALALAWPGAEIVSSSSVFSGTVSLWTTTLAKYGIQTRFFTPGHEETVADLINDNTAFVFTEVIGNPRLDVVDLPKLAQQTGGSVPLVVDTTLTPSWLLRTGDYGADVVVVSATKMLGGHGRALGGLVIDLGKHDWRQSITQRKWSGVESVHRKLALLAMLRNEYLANIGSCLSPDNAELILMGLESLAVRAERACSQALQIAQFLSEHPRVNRVCYPGLPEDPYHAVASSLFGGRGYGSVLTFELDSLETACAVADRLQMFQNLANIGDARSLVIHPWTTLGAALSPEARVQSGMSPGGLRLSIGLEDVRDLADDLDQALK